MKFLVSLAWKNLSRYHRRTIITALALAVGLGIFIFVDAWLKGAEEESERNLVWYETASARILDDEYWENKDNLPIKYTIKEPESIITQLEKRNVPAAPRTVFRGEIIVHQDPYEEDGSMMAKIIGIDPARDEEVFNFKNTIVDGRYLEEDEDAVLLGAWFAEDLGAEVGYPLIIVTRTKDGYYQTIHAKVAGIVNCPNPVINRSSVFIPLKTADYYLDMRGEVTEINLRFSDRNTAEKRAETIEEELSLPAKGLEVLPWQTLGADYVALASAKQGGSSFFLFLVFVIAAVGITNTMLMAVYERMRELGMMRALGMKDNQIHLTFLFEAGGIGLLGAAGGLLLGSSLTWWVVTYGVDFSFLLRDMDIGYRISGVMYGAWNPQGMVQAVIFGVLLSMVVAYFPTRRALKKPITECLRSQ